jgi:serine/threonine-protein phosphatase 2A activator
MKVSNSFADQTQIPVSAVLHPPLPDTNLYFMSIMRIHQVKHGPFHEHSSQLHSIATGVPNWGKVNSGLFKMYEVCMHSSFRRQAHASDVLQAEVLGKRVVVQHIPLGGLLQWNDAPAPTVAPAAPARVVDTPGATRAPWASSAPAQPAVVSSWYSTPLPGPNQRFPATRASGPSSGRLPPNTPPPTQ